nr:carboxypeptidase-like regulatory domain-containing protein [Saprospiraceae bacterium]
MNTRLLLLLFLALHRLSAQPAGEVVFMGRVVDAEQKSVKGARVILVGLSEARTDDDGLFRVSVPASVVEVQVELERYEVVYPRSGRAPVPRSSATPVVFEVKKMQGGEQERLVRQLRENVRKLENDKRFKENEIARLEKNMQDSIRTYQKLFDENGGRNSRLMDSLERKVQQLLASQEAALIAQKKEQLYGQITRTMLSFLDKAKNLRDALARIDDVFLSEAARAEFEK